MSAGNLLDYDSARDACSKKEKSATKLTAV